MPVVSGYNIRFTGSIAQNIIFRLKPHPAIRTLISSQILLFKKLRSNPGSFLRCPITGYDALHLLAFV